MKRLQFDVLSNELEIIRMNRNYKSRTVSVDADGLRILGKVVGWFHNEIQRDCNKNVDRYGFHQ